MSGKRDRGVYVDWICVRNYTVDLYLNIHIQIYSVYIYISFPLQHWRWEVAASRCLYLQLRYSCCWHFFLAGNESLNTSESSQMKRFIDIKSIEILMPFLIVCRAFLKSQNINPKQTRRKFHPFSVLHWCCMCACPTPRCFVRSPTRIKPHDNRQRKCREIPKTAFCSRLIFPAGWRVGISFYFRKDRTFIK